jgi:hypothetical protein
LLLRVPTVRLIARYDRQEMLHGGRMRRSQRIILICALVLGLPVLGGLVFVAATPVSVRWYFTVTLRPRQLPQRLIRPCFRRITDQELPEDMDGVRALFQGGVDPAIFVKFRTDSEGMKSICASFGEPQANVQIIDPNWMKVFTESGGHIFQIAYPWEERTGVELFHQEALPSGRMIEYLGPPGTGGYKVFLDDRNRTVYIHAFRL